MDRRRFLAALSLSGVSMAAGVAASPGRAASDGVDIHAILDDPEAPVGGNPKGDLPIVAFVDYNCPFCKRSAPELERFVAADGGVRLIYKDWPILAHSSVTGARLALAAKHQDKYQAAHAALMGLRGLASEAAMRDAIASAGVDMARLDKDLAANEEAIMALIRRNAAEARALNLHGTPVYLIGPYIVADALNYDGFSEVAAKFRSRLGK